jgi:hypothetical protein
MKRICPSNVRNLKPTAALNFVIPSVPGFPTTRHSPTATCAAFLKESRMKFANAPKVHRKSGAAEGSAVFLIRPDLQVLAYCTWSSAALPA